MYNPINPTNSTTPKTLLKPRNLQTLLILLSHLHVTLVVANTRLGHPLWPYILLSLLLSANLNELERAGDNDEEEEEEEKEEG